MPAVHSVISRRSTTPLPEGELPTSFPIFRPDSSGRIATTEGVDVFDAEAARSVIAKYRAQKNRLMLDLEHLSLTGKGPGSTDAMAWFDLAMRGSELWAVNVKFTAEGARRVRARSQVFVSPAFLRDPKTNRITELINCALVALPATHGATQLIAASKLGTRTSGTITTRLPNELRNRVIAAARRWRATPGEYLRTLASALTSKNPERILRLVAETLGLEKDAPAAEVTRVLAELIAELDAADPAPADPTAAGGAEPTPHELYRSFAKSRRERAIARVQARIDAYEAIPPAIRKAGPEAIKRWHELRAKRERDRASRTSSPYRSPLSRRK